MRANCVKYDFFLFYPIDLLLILKTLIVPISPSVVTTDFRKHCAAIDDATEEKVSQSIRIECKKAINQICCWTSDRSALTRPRRTLWSGCWRRARWRRRWCSSCHRAPRSSTASCSLWTAGSRWQSRALCQNNGFSRMRGVQRKQKTHKYT